MKPLFFIGTLLLLASCANDKKPHDKYVAQMTTQQAETLQEDAGKKLMEAYCYACHGPELKGDNRLAPPMIAVKKHYQEEGITEQEFVGLIVDWAKEPSREKSRMPGALKRFGIMPYQPFPEDSLKLIASYIYHHEMERPGGHGHGKGMGKGKRGKGKKQNGHNH